MRVQVPQRFSMTMTGPEGRYELVCSPYEDDPREGWIQVTISGVAMAWGIDSADQTAEGVRLSGFTLDANEIWGDAFSWSRAPREAVRLGSSLGYRLRADRW